MWEEVAFKYQQILHREYRMLNLPTYPVSGGSVYFYYVPVIISPQLVSHHDDINNSCDSKLKAANESSGKNADVIYISEDSDDDSIANVKKEPLEFEKSLEKYSFGNRIKEENYNKRFISCEMEKKQISVINTEKNLVTVKLENEFDTNYPCTEFKQDTKIVSGENRDNPNSREKENEEQPAEAQYSSENKVEVREGHIRIIKGYTIEYHPMPSVGTLNRWPSRSQMESQDDRKRVEKISDLKRRLAEQEEELEKLRWRHSAEHDVSMNGHAQGLLKQKCGENNHARELTSHSVWKPINDCPSTQIHYFPSGERKTSPARRNSRKQSFPRRIDAVSNTKTDKDIRPFIQNIQIEENPNGEIHGTVSKRKRKLTPSPELVREKPVESKRVKPIFQQKNSSKRGHSSKKAKVCRSRRKIRQASKQNSEVTSAGNVCKALEPQDITQDEFLSIFGLARKPRNSVEH